MTLPLATTSVTILRPVAGADPDPYVTQPAPTTVASGVRAVVSISSGVSIGGGGTEIGGQESVLAGRLLCDVTDLQHTDRVLDAQTGETYDVTWVAKRVGLGLDHMAAGLRVTKGQAP